MSTMRNSVMMVGRPTRPTMDTERGQATFKIVVEDSVNKTCITNTFDCVATGETAKQIVKNVKEGKRVAIDGCLRNHDYTDRLGDTHTHTEILVFDIFLIDKTKEDRP